jgi:hypothetical protein
VEVTISLKHLETAQEFGCDRGIMSFMAEIMRCCRDLVEWVLSTVMVD